MTIAIARPTPNWRRLATSDEAEGEEHAEHAQRGAGHDARGPREPDLDGRAASPLRSHSSRTRLTMNTW